jgi:hypothetical protein
MAVVVINGTLQQGQQLDGLNCIDVDGRPTSRSPLTLRERERGAWCLEGWKKKQVALICW